MTGIGILWIPVVQNVQGGQLFLYIQQVQLYFCPPIASIYLIAILWSKVTEKVHCIVLDKDLLLLYHYYYNEIRKNDGGERR